MGKTTKQDRFPGKQSLKGDPRVESLDYQVWGKKRVLK